MAGSCGKVERVFWFESRPIISTQCRYYISASRCYDVSVSKTRTTLTIDEEVLRAVKIRAARTGKGDGQVIEEALRRDLGLDVLDDLWSRNDLDEAESLDLAVEAQHATRPVKP
jgi:hypothetical protein